MTFLYCYVWNFILCFSRSLDDSRTLLGSRPHNHQHLKHHPFVRCNHSYECMSMWHQPQSFANPLALGRRGLENHRLLRWRRRRYLGCMGCLGKLGLHLYNTVSWPGSANLALNWTVDNRALWIWAPPQQTRVLSTQLDAAPLTGSPSLFSLSLTKYGPFPTSPCFTSSLQLAWNRPSFTSWL